DRTARSSRRHRRGHHRRQRGAVVRLRLRPGRHRPRHRHRLPRRPGRDGHGPPARGGRHGADHHVPRHRLHRGPGPHRVRGLHPPQVRL
ncbi:MAG: ATP synthase F0 sector subunit c, partial [uncultured Acidimicrobiales bacterium]